jgi:hypothetical protein
MPPAAPDGTFSRDDFTYDHKRDVYRCPGGTALPTTGTLVVFAMAFLINGVEILNTFEVHNVLFSHRLAPELEPSRRLLSQLTPDFRRCCS